MKTLFDYMNERLHDIPIGNGYETIEDFINDDKESANFIRKALNDEFAFTDKENSTYTIAETRARHSVITFLMGLVFWTNLSYIVNSLQEKLTFCKDFEDMQKIWMMVSMYHDYGYFSEYIKRENFSYKVLRHQLLSQDSVVNKCSMIDILAFNHDEIMEYDKAARIFHCKSGDEEKIDHGILGGHLIFDRLMRKMHKCNNFNEQSFISVSALTIAQHNMYKSNTIEDDKRFANKPKILRSESSFRLSINTPLLLLLCIVDTIECIKKFSKSANEKKHLKSVTVLKSIFVVPTANRIELDLTHLKERILEKQDNGLMEIYENYKNSIINLSNWTTLKCGNCGERFTIELSKNKIRR